MTKSMNSTATVSLNLLREEDAPSGIRLLMDEQVKQTYMLPDFTAPEQASKLFLRLKELSLDESHYVRGIYADGVMVGFLNDVQIENGTIELGWALHPDYWGRGYCTAAVKLAIEELFRIGFTEVTAGAFRENPASIRVMEKCAMTKIPFEETIEYRGKHHDCVYYHILKG